MEIVINLSYFSWLLHHCNYSVIFIDNENLKIYCMKEINFS